MRHLLLRFIYLFLSLTFSKLYGACSGKVDLGLTVLDVDIMESGKTVKTMHMKGLKGDSIISVWQGVCLKPGFIWARGDGQLTAGTIAIGDYLPLTSNLRILPNVGVSWSYLYTRIDIEALNQFNLKERFRSCSPFIGLEVCYIFAKKWTLMAIYQYAWSHTHTKIGSIVSSKSHSSGPNYALGIDYSINKNWSIVFGVGYNITLSHEKHGIRGKGAKLGLAYYF